MKSQFTRSFRIQTRTPSPCRLWPQLKPSNSRNFLLLPSLVSISCSTPIRFEEIVTVPDDEFELVLSDSEDENGNVADPLAIENDVNLDEKAKMKAIGLPSSFSKGQVCIPLNSLNNVKKDIQVPPKLEIPQKPEVPALRLRDKLQDLSKPFIVGLTHIKEIIAISKISMVPHYECGLCTVKGDPDVILDHILGKQHQDNFFKDLFCVSDPEVIANLTSEIETFQENGKVDLIQTIYSDDLYPWPAGQAPWSTEQGGTGMLPTILTLDSNPQERRTAHFQLQNPPTLNSRHSLNAHYRALSEMLEKTREFQKARSSDQAKINTVHSLIKANIALLASIKLTEDM